MTGARLVFSLCLLAVFMAGTQGQCPNDTSMAAVELGYSCLEPLLEGFTSHSKKRFPNNFYSLSGWEKFCMGHEQLEPCVKGVFSSCDQDYMSQVVTQARLELRDRWLKAGFYPRPTTCNGSIPSDSTKQVYQAVGDDCLDQVTDTVDMCLDDWLEEVEFVKADDLALFRRWAHSTFQCGVGLVPGQCGETGRALAKFLLEQTFPEHVTSTLTEKDLDQPLSSNELLSTKRTTTGVFGDPHIILYKHQGLVTCEAKGKRPYMANEYFKLEGESTRVGILPDSRATFLSMFKIQFLDGDLTYSAANGALPSTLSNGKTSGKAGDHTVELSVDSKGVSLTVPSMGLMLEARRWQTSYLFTLRASDNMYRKSHGLLISGCPSQETINIRVTPSRRRRHSDPTVTRCEEECKNNQDHPTCLYDCVNTHTAFEADMTEGALSRRRRSQDPIAIMCDMACDDIPDEGGFHYHRTCMYDCLNYRNGTAADMTTDFKESLQSVLMKDGDLDLILDASSGASIRPWSSIQPWSSLVLLLLAVYLS